MQFHEITLCTLAKTLVECVWLTGTLNGSKQRQKRVTQFLSQFGGACVVNQHIEQLTVTCGGTMQICMVIHTRFVILGIPVTNQRGISRFKHAIEKFNESQKIQEFSIDLKLKFLFHFSWWKLVNRHSLTFKYSATRLRHPFSRLQRIVLGPSLGISFG